MTINNAAQGSITVDSIPNAIAFTNVIVQIVINSASDLVAFISS